MIHSALLAQAGQPSYMTGLLNHWPLNGNSQGVYGNNGTDTAMTYVTGPVGQCGVFNGTTSTISLSNPVWSTGKVSVAAWVQTSAASSYREIIATVYQVSFVSGFELRMQTGNKLEFVIGNNTNLTQGSGYQFCDSTTSINTGAWFHVAATYDGALMKVYVNGVLENTVAYAGGMAFNATRYTAIGTNNYNGSPNYFWSGSIDEVMLWNRDITQAEVAALYTGPFTRGLVGYWPLDGDNRDVACSNNGVDSSMTYSTGYKNSGGVFNGSTSAITVPNPQMKTPFVTVAAWVKTTTTGAYGEIVCSHNSVGAQAAGFELRLNSSGKAELVIGSNAAGGQGVNYQFCPSLTSINTGAWFHVAGTYDGYLLRIYVNGVMESAVLFYGVGNLGMVFGTSRVTVFGWSPVLGNRFNGMIDEVRIWDRALPPSEVVMLVNDLFTGLPLPRVLDGLIGYWPLDGRAIPGGAAGAVTNAAGPTGLTGNCSVFDGSTSYVALPSVGWTQGLTTGGPTYSYPGGSITAAAWIKTTYSGAYKEIFCCMDQDAGTIAGFELRLNPSAQPDFVIGTNTGWGVGAYGNITSPTAINDGNWHHVVGTHDGATMRIYVDGTQVQSGAFAYPLRFSAIRPARIGVTYYVGGTSSQYFWSGSIDEVMLWDRALSATEIATLTTVAYTPPSSLMLGLALYLKLDSNLVDASGQVDAASWTNFGATWVTGVFLNALHCTNAGGVHGVNANVILHDDVTVSMWIKQTSSTGTQACFNAWDGGQDVTAFDVLLIGGVVYVDGGFLGAVSSGLSLPLNTWAHLAVTRNAFGVGRVWVNGVPSPIMTGLNPGISWEDMGDHNLGIGDDRDGWGLNADVDEVAAWNRSLTDDEIARLAAGTRYANF